MGYNGVDYFSPENDYCIAADQLGWRLAHINRMFEDLGKPPVVRTWSSSPTSRATEAGLGDRTAICGRLARTA
jgi:hypothetical protein